LLKLCKHANFQGFSTFSLLQCRHDIEGIHLRHVLEAVFFSHGTTDRSDPGPPHYYDFMITLRHTTHSRTPLDE